MRHVYECPLRWADMDMLGHVNNVTWVDYLQEARIDMFAVHAGFSGVADLAEGVVVVRHEVDFVAPLVFRRQPVLVDVWISEIRAASFTMAYEVYDEVGGEAGRPERKVYLRASSVLSPYVFESANPRRLTATEKDVLQRFHEPAAARTPVPSAGTSRHVHPMKVRLSDLDVYRHVNNVKYFEYFQEARIQYVMDLHQRGEVWSDHVIARTDVEYLRPVEFRLQPYQVHQWISHLGSRSFAIASELRDGDVVLARGRVVMVTFDKDSQRSAPMPPQQRARLEQEYAAAASAGA
ncbi:MAG: acyl-CoA thioesterase [Marmoricola sp.]